MRNTDTHDASSAKPILTFVVLVRGDAERLSKTFESISTALQQVDLDVQILLSSLALSPLGVERCSLALAQACGAEWFYSSASFEAELLNQAVHVARGLWLWVLEAGDVLSSHAILSWDECRRLNPSALMVAGDGQHLDASHSPVRLHPAPSPHIWPPELACRGLYCFGAIVWSRRVLDHIGGFAESLQAIYLDAWLLVLLEKYASSCFIKNDLWVSTHHYSDWSLSGRCRQRALELTALMADILGSSPAVFIHTYGLQLQRDEAICSPTQSPLEQVAQLLNEVRPLLGEHNFNQISVAWGLDPSVLPIQQMLNASLEAGGLAQLWSVRLLADMVVPGLSSLQLGPDAGPHLRLAQRLISPELWSSYLLLHQDPALIALLNTGIHSIPLVGILYWLESDLLQTSFPLPDSADHYLAWWILNAAQRCPHLSLDSGGRLLDCSQQLVDNTSFEQRPFGVNLIGHAFEHFGVAEDVRMAALALRSVGVPFCVVNIPAHQLSGQPDKLLAPYVLPPGEDGPYKFNLVCMTALSHAEWIARSGLSQQHNRYTISAWPWETQSWPHKWHIATSLTNSLWPSSSFTARAFESLPLTKPLAIKVMSMAVHIPNVDSYRLPDQRLRAKRRWGLDANCKCILYVFDAKSVLERKNPFSAIEAFQAAFPPTGPDQVLLIIKALPPQGSSRLWENLLAVSEKDWRIRIITDDLSKDDLLTLMGACDIYLSLHRSEGFGRTIAEAALLGLEIVATDFGGNVDFCHGDGFYMVPTSPWPIPAGIYPQAEGHLWGDPDLAIASTFLRQAFASPIIRSPRNIPSLSIEYVGSNYQKVLEYYLQDDDVVCHLGDLKG